MDRCQRCSKIKDTKAFDHVWDWKEFDGIMHIVYVRRTQKKKPETQMGMPICAPYRWWNTKVEEFRDRSF
jgi:hypothetical protein